MLGLFDSFLVGAPLTVAGALEGRVRSWFELRGCDCFLLHRVFARRYVVMLRCCDVAMLQFAGDHPKLARLWVCEKLMLVYVSQRFSHKSRYAICFWLRLISAWVGNIALKPALSVRRNL